MPRSRNLPAELETDPKKVLEVVVGLPDVSVLGVDTSGVVVDLHVEKVTELVGLAPQYRTRCHATFSDLSSSKLTGEIYPIEL